MKKSTASDGSVGIFAALAGRFIPDPKTRLGVKMSFASFCEDFALFRLYRKLVDAFLKTNLRASSGGFFAFGFLVALFSFIKASSGGAADRVPGIVFGLAVILGSVPMAFSNSRWSETLQRSRIADGWLGYVCGYRAGEIRRDGVSPRGGVGFVVTGVVAGLLTAFFDPFTVVMGICGTVLALQILYKPEIGLSLEILCFAFVPRTGLLILALFTLFAYAVKVLRGKRVFSVNSCDVLIFLLFVFWISGAFFGLVEPMGMLLAFVLCFLFSKLVVTADMARRLSGLFVFTLLAFSVSFFFIGFVRDPSNALANYVRSVFDPDENTFVVPIDTVMMLLPVAAVGVLKKGAMKFISFAALALGLCTLLFSGSSGALLCFFVSLILLAVILGKKMIWLAAGTVAVAGAVTAIFYSSVVPLFTGIPGLFSNALAGFTPSFDAVFNRPLLCVIFGEIGVGDTGLSFWPDLMIRFGLAGLFIYLLTLASVLRRAYLRFKGERGRISRLAMGLSVAVATILLRGTTALITVQSGAFVFSWLLLGLLCGLGEIGPREKPVKEW